MLVGVPKEIKVEEYRVGLIPATIADLVAHGHEVLVEHGAGEGAGISDDEYVDSGAKIAASAGEIFKRATLIVKVKEPQGAERKQLRRGQILFAYLHLAPDREQAIDLMASGVSAIAYETVADAAGRLPLLAPMSQVAGRMAPQVAAHFLQRSQGGRGILIGGADGVEPASVVILGSGTVGRSAAMIALGMGAHVTLVAHSATSAARLAEQFGERPRIVVGDPERIASLCRSADVAIGAALVAGARAPKLVSAATIAAMNTGTVIVDVSIDQGGCFETSRPTTHASPTYTVDGVIHYCVANMPGAVPRTSTFTLNKATRPFVLALADKGLTRALAEDVHLRNGLNVHDGKITHQAVADALGLAL